MARALHFVTLAASVAVHFGAVAVFSWGTRSRPPPIAISTGLVGETFEISETDSVSDSVSNSVPVPAPDSESAPESVSESASESVSESGSVSTRRVTHVAHSPGARAAALPPPLYGALGDRSAVDIATAFTRAFPQASSGDVAWNQVPFGSLGSIDVTLELDVSGQLVRTSKSVGNTMLTRAIDRTMALIASRAFTGTSAITQLRITGNVSADEVHDGLHGDVFAIGGSYSGAEGNAFFALNSGRRIDITVRALSHR